MLIRKVYRVKGGTGTVNIPKQIMTLLRVKDFVAVTTDGKSVILTPVYPKPGTIKETHDES